MDKKEMKRDVAVFANMLKELMNDPLPDPLTTLDRDLQHFLYGRISLLVKHNDDEPVGSIVDVGTVVGAALADVIREFTRTRVEGDELAQAFANVRENLVAGFDIKTPKVTVESSAITESTVTE